MRLSQELLERCEEFFEEIQNESGNVDIDHAMDSLRSLLEEDVDGWTQLSDEKLALAVQSRLEEIWELVVDEEKETDLSVYYTDLISDLEEISGFESDSTPYELPADEDEQEDDEYEDYEEGDDE